jgi:hypothetical protein
MRKNLFLFFCFVFPVRTSAFPARASVFLASLSVFLASLSAFLASLSAFPASLSALTFPYYAQPARASAFTLSETDLCCSYFHVSGINFQGTICNPNPRLCEK